jgi:hypothetical protein
VEVNTSVERAAPAIIPGKLEQIKNNKSRKKVPWSKNVTAMRDNLRHPLPEPHGVSDVQAHTPPHQRAGRMSEA